MTLLQLTCLVVGLSLIPSSTPQIPDITYSMAWYILPYTPMPDLYNFVQALNTKDTTTADKKARATKFIGSNWGKPKVQNATYFNTQTKAQTSFAALIVHRQWVNTFWNDFLSKQLLKLFNGNTDQVKAYKTMYLQVDRTYDQDFWTVVNNWYMFSYYHIATDKRDPLYDAINNAITNYYGQSTFASGKDPIDFTIYTADYISYLNATFFYGYW